VSRSLRWLGLDGDSTGLANSRVKQKGIRWRRKRGNRRVEKLAEDGRIYMLKWSSVRIHFFFPSGKDEVRIG
jgi:hypothetical protein